MSTSANINRLLSCINKNDKESEVALNGYESKFGLFNSKSIIPNQILPTAKNTDSRNTCIYFSPKALYGVTKDYLDELLSEITKLEKEIEEGNKNKVKLEILLKKNEELKLLKKEYKLSLAQFRDARPEGLIAISRLHEKQKELARKNNTTYYPIEYLCYGTKDTEGNIVIDSIQIPALEFLIDEHTSVDQAVTKLLTSKKSSKDRRYQDLELTSQLSEYIRTKKLAPYQKAIVCLIGTTGTGMPQHCLPLSLIAKSIVPGDVLVSKDIVTGAIGIDSSKMQGYNMIAIDDIEAVTIEYSKLNKKGTRQFTTTPSKIRNIKECYGEFDKAGLSYMRTSYMDQPGAKPHTLPSL